MIKKGYDELKPGDVFQLSNGRTYILVIETIPHGAKVLINGFPRRRPREGRPQLQQQLPR